MFHAYDECTCLYHLKVLREHTKKQNKKMSEPAASRSVKIKLKIPYVQCGCGYEGERRPGVL